MPPAGSNRVYQKHLPRLKPRPKQKYFKTLEEFISMFQRRGVVKVEYHMNDPLLFVNGVLELT